MSASQSVSDNDFDAEVLKAGQPVMVDFYADWCGPCKAMSPLVDEVAANFGGQIKIVKVNIDDSPHAPTKYGVRGVPTFMIFKDGKVADSRVGSMPKSQFVDWIKSAI